MRTILSLVVAVAAVLTVGACQHADSAERSAEIVAKKGGATSVAAVAPVAPASVTAMVAQAAPAAHSCGGAGGCGTGSCGPSCGCGASCGGGGDAHGGAVTWNTPKDAAWTELHVAGMHCGGCARRIEHALAKVDGVLGVEVDLAKASVKIATVSGKDVRGLAKPAIDALGYQVQ